MTNKICPECGHNDHVVDDPAGGQSFCDVHKIIIDNTFLQEKLEFNAAGKAMGTLMPKSGGLQPMIRPVGIGTRGKPGAMMTSDPRQQRINKFFTIIDQIAKQLNINQSIRDMGHNYHKLASIHKNSN
jgi:transcription initiation factor TFIIIB Brf1 subunit/transcription initiation factor TFIIB